MATERRGAGWATRFMLDKRRYAKDTATKREGMEWEAAIRAQVAAGKTPNLKKDNRKLSELAETWFNLHGFSLKDGRTRLVKLRHIIKLLGDPLARNFTGKQFAEFRVKRLEVGMTPNNCNHELSYLKAVFNELIRQDEWLTDNPLKKVRPLKFDEKEMRYLTDTEIKKLMWECERSRSPHLETVVSICLATGARWNEANQLRREHLQKTPNGWLVIFEGTKSGKIRRIPIPDILAEKVMGVGGHGRLFKDCQTGFKRAIERGEIYLPRGQLTHVLRHTFASHFMMKGGDILTLQKILGHSTLTMTLRYAHLAPDHLQQAKVLSPYAILITTELPQAANNPSLMEVGQKLAGNLTY